MRLPVSGAHQEVGLVRGRAAPQGGVVERRDGRPGPAPEDHPGLRTPTQGGPPAATVPAVITVAAVGVALLAALAVFQLALVAGAPLGRFAWGGQHVVLPPRLRAGSVVSVVLYALFALLMLQAAGATSLLPDGVAAVGIWVLTGYLALGVALNAISRSRPERLVMTPVALVLLAVCLVLALG